MMTMKMFILQLPNRLAAVAISRKIVDSFHSLGDNFENKCLISSLNIDPRYQSAETAQQMPKRQKVIVNILVDKEKYICM